MDNTYSLQLAHSLFEDKQYDKALFLYSQVSSLDPTNSEYQLYSIFCDIASENEERGHSLFDYFTIAKTEDYKNAITSAMDIINAYDTNNDKIVNILNDKHQLNVDNLDAINYKDFEVLIEQRGSFKIAFQDIMFSTKVALTSKDEFIEFVTLLIDNDFEKTAYHYLDGFNEHFKYDTQMMELYNKLGSKTIDLNRK